MHTKYSCAAVVVVKRLESVFGHTDLSLIWLNAMPTKKYLQKTLVMLIYYNFHLLDGDRSHHRLNQIPPIFPCLHF